MTNFLIGTETGKVYRTKNNKSAISTGEITNDGQHVMWIDGIGHYYFSNGDNCAGRKPNAKHDDTIVGIFHEASFQRFEKLNPQVGDVFEMRSPKGESYAVIVKARDTHGGAPWVSLLYSQEGIDPWIDHASDFEEVCRLIRRGSYPIPTKDAEPAPAPPESIPEIDMVGPLMALPLNDMLALINTLLQDIPMREFAVAMHQHGHNVSIDFKDKEPGDDEPSKD